MFRVSALRSRNDSMTFECLARSLFFHSVHQKLFRKCLALKVVIQDPPLSSEYRSEDDTCSTFQLSSSFDTSRFAFFSRRLLQRLSIYLAEDFNGSFGKHNNDIWVHIAKCIRRIKRKVYSSFFCPLIFLCVFTTFCESFPFTPRSRLFRNIHVPASLPLFKWFRRTGWIPFHFHFF